MIKLCLVIIFATDGVSELNKRTLKKFPLLLQVNQINAIIKHE